MHPTTANPKSEIHNPQSQRLFTFASGGWVVVLVLLICAGLIAWAIAPVVLRLSQRPPGDGQTLETFQFDLSNLSVPRELIAPAMLHRDMVPAMSSPSHSQPGAGEDRWNAMQSRNDPKYGKYLVSTDVVIGVVINDEARCYPLHVMYVHEIVNDALGGTPIAVTYNWLTDSPMVFDRRINSSQPTVAEFAISGLVYNSNLLMYDRNESRTDAGKGVTPTFGGGNESLWCQLLGRAVSGRQAALNASLTIIPCEVTTWRDWSERHPQTTVLDRDLAHYERYKDAAPTQYFKSDKILFPFAGADQPRAMNDLAPKTRVLAVITSEACRVYPIPFVLNIATPAADGSVQWTDTLGSRTLRFIGDPQAGTLRVECDPPDLEMLTARAFWFAWHAMHPEDELMTRPPTP